MLNFKKFIRVIYTLSFAFLFSFSFELNAQNETAEVEEIIVTGSRIKTTATDSFSPVSIVDQEDILLSGKISIGEVLLELPGQGSGLNRNYNNGGDGSVRIDFRNLGSQRHICLVLYLILVRVLLRRFRSITMLLLIQRMQEDS